MALLHHVRQLVSQQPLAFESGGGELPCSKDNVRADGVSPSSELMGRLGRLRPGMHPHLAEVVPKPGFHPGTVRLGERLSGAKPALVKPLDGLADKGLLQTPGVRARAVCSLTGGRARVWLAGPESFQELFAPHEFDLCRRRL